MTRLIALYPRDWRDRYGDEFLALLADRPPDPIERLDIIRGALDARLHPQVQGSRGTPDAPAPARRWAVRAGWLTLIGGLLWLAALAIAVNGPVVVEAEGTYRDGSAALPLWFVAILLLGVGLIALALELPTPARRGRAAAYAGSLIGLLWAFAPWFLTAGVVAFAALLVVAVEAWRAGRWSGLELGTLLVVVGFGWGVPAAHMFGLWAPSDLTLDGLIWSLALLALAWIVVGASLVRAPRRRDAFVDPSTV